MVNNYVSQDLKTKVGEARDLFDNATYRGVFRGFRLVPYIGPNGSEILKFESKVEEY